MDLADVLYEQEVIGEDDKDMMKNEKLTRRERSSRLLDLIKAQNSFEKFIEALYKSVNYNHKQLAFNLTYDFFDADELD